MPRSVTAAASNTHSVVSGHLRGPGKRTSSSRAGDGGAVHSVGRAEHMAGTTGATGIAVFSLLWSGFLFRKGTMGCCSLVSVEPEHFASPLWPAWVLSPHTALAATSFHSPPGQNSRCNPPSALMFSPTDLMSVCQPKALAIHTALCSFLPPSPSLRTAARCTARPWSLTKTQVTLQGKIRSAAWEK